MGEDSERTVSVGGRAALAMLLMVGFYGLALGVIAGLLWIPYAEIAYAGRIHFRLAAFCLLGAGAIGWSILPRRDRFEAPGPRLQPESHPRLFEVIEQVAERTGQKMPSEVYAVAEVNAFVTERGGVMGVGSRRVMGIGIPLLQLLSVAQLRAVIAHEFGHFHGGDTKLGPWVYKTRAAIGRTLESLSESWLSKPFEWYGHLFVRISHAVSRRQELAADALAARVAGARALVEGLKRVSGGAAAYAAYWRQEAQPVLSEGYRIPMANGFSHYLRAEPVLRAVQAHVDRALEEGSADPYDTHPCLRDRIAAVAPQIDRDEPDDDRRALELLGEVASVETDLLASRSSEQIARSLKPISWEEVGTEVYAPAWRRHAVTYREVTSGLTVGGLPGAATDLAALARRLPPKSREEGSEEQWQEMAAEVLAISLGVSLVEAGFTLRGLPGEPLLLERAGESVDATGTVRDLRRGALTPDAWADFCERHGLSNRSLQPEPAPDAPVEAPVRSRRRRR